MSFATVSAQIMLAHFYSTGVNCILINYLVDDEEIAKASGRRKTEAYVEASRIVLAKLRAWFWFLFLFQFNMCVCVFFFFF